MPIAFIQKSPSAYSSVVIAVVILSGWILSI